MTDWTPYIGQSLQLCCENDNNEHNDHAVCVSKANGTVVGHAPREMSHTFWYCLMHGGQIECKITGRRNHGNGLEVPYNYHFSGGQKLIDKLKSILSNRKVTNFHPY